MSNQTEQHATKKNFHTIQEGEYYRQRNGQIVQYRAAVINRYAEGHCSEQGLFESDFVEHVIVMPAEPQRQIIKMHVGGTYRDSNGDIVLCTHYDAASNLYKAFGNDYHEDGTLSNRFRDDAVLIEEIK